MTKYNGEISSAQLKPLQDSMTRVKYDLVKNKNTVFFSTISFGLEHRFNFDVGTAHVTYKNINYNPNFWDTLTREQRLGLMAHEISHITLGHMDPKRIGGRTLHTWYKACDHVINLGLRKSNIQIPDGGLEDVRFEGMSTERVYDILEAERLASPEPEITQEMLDQMDFSPIQGSPEEIKRIIRDQEDLVLRAAMAAESAGAEPGMMSAELEMRLQALRTPLIPWDVRITQYFQQRIKTDYSYSRTNRRYAPMGMILPTISTGTAGNIACALDMSGSMEDHQVTQCVTDISNLLKRVAFTKMVMIQFDGEITSEAEIKSADELLEHRYVGRGGTCVAPVIEWAKENKPDVIAIFTDGDFYDLPSDPGIPVLWIIHDRPDFTVPYGTVINYEIGRP